MSSEPDHDQYPEDTRHVWTADDQAYTDRLTEHVVALAVPLRGKDLKRLVVGNVQASGSLIRLYLQQEPAQLAFCLAMIARLVDYVNPPASCRDAGRAPH